ncbi:HmuY family protein [Pedobacter sp. ISL-68]|uniref:HmuY family protein n=1 Tax=unclassified Pedobacter TaxID=2628915 RepID=UPI001BECE6A6|nr:MULTISPECIES: HmuY family protein [unclassified Pedobacter]MBT2560150.1 HmuY family protein [Pedobacter sp. ISL-64]MBT2589129.1 HmuY family protein [Pedobacter sp. ISL-68]
MRNTIITKRLVWLVLALPLLIASCKKDEVGPSLEDGKSTVINDLAGDTQASMGNATPGKEQRPFYIFLFRFKDQKQIWIRNAADSAQYLKTKDWDIAFTGPYNSEVYVNDKDYQYNPGFGGTAESSVVMLNKSYDNVSQAPQDQDFNTSDITKIGWAASESIPGWFFYSLNTHISQAIPNRTFVIHLPDGKYAKLQLISVYKGNPPTVTDLNWPAPYLTFRYYVQQDGSKNLSTSN